LLGGLLLGVLLLGGLLLLGVSFGSEEVEKGGGRAEGL
jgi:hypothetical protein